MKTETAFWSARARAMRWKPSPAARLSFPPVEPAPVETALGGQAAQQVPEGPDTGARPRRSRRGRAAAAETAPQAVAEAPEGDIDLDIPEFLRRPRRPAHAAPIEGELLRHDARDDPPEPDPVAQVLDRLDPIGGVESCLALVLAAILFLFGSQVGGIAVLAFAAIMRLARARA